jgi:hypothetical protein
MDDSEASFQVLEDEAKRLLAQAGYTAIKVYRVDGDAIVFRDSGGCHVGWKHARHVERKMRGVNVGVIVEASIHVVDGWPAVEMVFYDDDA